MNTDKYIEDVISVAEGLNWDVRLGEQPDRKGGIEKYAEFGKPSPAGEDYYFTAFYDDAESLVRSVRESADDFDIDEHVGMWVEAKINGVVGVPSICELVGDARAIEKMMCELACELSEYLWS